MPIYNSTVLKTQENVIFKNVKHAAKVKGNILIYATFSRKLNRN